jgi:hypothetical protein
MMDNFDEYEFEEVDEDEHEEESPPEESSNRTFIIVAGALGAILILSLICMAVYAFWFLPPRQAAQQTQVAEVNAQNTSVAMSSGMTAEAGAWTETPTITATQAPNTPTSSPTPVVAATDTPASEASAHDPTLTLAALLTSKAGGEVTVTPLPTGLPKTGFADEVGIPGMLALAAALVVIIFLARRLRTAG